jgi:hypothetical protein
LTTGAKIDDVVMICHMLNHYLETELSFVKRELFFLLHRLF